MPCCGQLYSCAYAAAWCCAEGSAWTTAAGRSIICSGSCIRLPVPCHGCWDASSSAILTFVDAGRTGGRGRVLARLLQRDAARFAHTCTYAAPGPCRASQAPGAMAGVPAVMPAPAACSIRRHYCLPATKRRQLFVWRVARRTAAEDAETRAVDMALETLRAAGDGERVRAARQRSVLLPQRAHCLLHRASLKRERERNESMREA